MACILLVEPGPVARKALQGILARAEHRTHAVASAQEARDAVIRNVRVDLIFTELALSGENGLSLIESLKADPLLRTLPITVLTARAERETLRRCLAAGVQNVLLQPAAEETILAEVAKAESDPWRAHWFEEENAFCRLLGLTRDDLHRQLDALHRALQAAQPAVSEVVRSRSAGALNAIVQPVREQAESTGAWGVVEVLDHLQAAADAGAWQSAEAALCSLSFAAELIPFWLDPARLGPDFLPKADVPAGPREQERALWTAAALEGRTPLRPPEELGRLVEALTGCPVIDSAAAAFQLTATGHPSCINPLMDLVARDPGLTVQMLISAQHVRHSEGDDFDRIEDARLAVGQLGEVRLEQQARALLTVDESTLNLAPALDWPRYWAFQRGVARLAQLVCRDLGFDSLETVARSAGQLHDFGLLLVGHLHPGGLQAILTHVRRHGTTRPEAERLHLGTTTADLAVRFALHHGLSRRLVNVLRWMDNPAQASEDAQLVAIISLARDLCRENGVGVSGEPPHETGRRRPLEETPEWHILREGLYPSFDLRKFEHQVHSYCVRLRTELHGRESGTVADLIGAGSGLR